MKKFIATSLTLAALANLSAASFALDTTCVSSGKSSLCLATLVKPSTAAPWASENMRAICLGVVRLELKNLDNFMQNSEVQVSAKEEPLHYRFNPFELSTFLRKAPNRKNVNKFELDGVKKKSNWFRPFTRFYNWLCDARVPVKYRLVPITNAEARPFFTKPFREGEKKLEAKDKDEFIDKILANKGNKSDIAEISDMLVQKAKAGLADKNVDPYDPYDVIRKGTLIKYAKYKDQVDTDKYYSKKEAFEKNIQIQSQILNVCNSFEDKYDDELEKQGMVTTLSAETPVRHFAIVVNNNIDSKPEAYKLFKLFEQDNDFIKDDTSLIEFSARKIINISKDALPNSRDLSEVNDLLDSVKDKPSMSQWFVNLKDSFFTLVDSMLPQFVSDFIHAAGSAAGDALKKAGVAMKNTNSSSTLIKKVKEQLELPDKVKKLEDDIKGEKDARKVAEDELNNMKADYDKQKSDKEKLEKSHEKLINDKMLLEDEKKHLQAEQNLLEARLKNMEADARLNAAKK